MSDWMFWGLLILEAYAWLSIEAIGAIRGAPIRNDWED